ncbi:MAG TPA: hypothetical protein VNS12_09370 [Pelagibacterium sp.]|uniref:hypothetical protein n=1 Tax=Pelagibacterium sp. TaxID=1967288 RepID=UPI002C70F6D8|nr:hypothetical protein [Pelagibacterium sp.]HWJ88267.1 hypothetical protein [Pelagibacterium sp.]
MAQDERIENGEISLLDLLVIIAEHWLVLVVVPLLIGVLAFGMVSMQPHSYRSEAVLTLPAAVISPLGDTEPGLSITQDTNTGTTQLVLAGPDPDVTMRLTAIISGIELAIEAGELPDARGELLDQIAVLDQSMALRDGIIARITTALSDLERASPFDTQAYAAASSALEELLTGRQDAQVLAAELRNELAAIPTEIVVSAPTNASLVGRSPLLMALLATLGAGFVLLIAVFMRAGFRNAAQDEDGQEKLDRIKNALLLRKTKSRNAA